MTGTGPTSQRPHFPRDSGAPDTGASSMPPAPSAMQRANRLSAANMLRSLLPLVVLLLLFAGWRWLGESEIEPVREVDPATTVELAASRADYPVLVPADLSEEFRPTSARTDAGNAADGAPITLQIGYYTPSEEFAGFVLSDDPGAAPLRSVLDGAQEQGQVRIGGDEWTRSTTVDGETVFSRVVEGVTVLVTGSAPDEELRTVAESVRPYAG